MSSGTTTYGLPSTLTIQSQTSTETIFLIKETCSGSGNYCADNSIVKFQISKGFANVGFVTTPTNFFTIRTYTRDNSYIIDQVKDKSATPDVIPAIIVVSSVTLTSNYATYTGVTLDINLKFGATIKPGIYLLLTISDEFIRMDQGALTCFLVQSSVETAKTCTTTQTSNVVNTITIPNLCTTSCDETTSYTIRIKNLIPKSADEFYVAAFTGTMLIETRVSSASLVMFVFCYTLNYQLSSVATLLPGPLTNTVVTRSKSTQGVTADYTITWKTPSYLIDDSLVEIRFPLNQIIISSGSAFTFKNGVNSLTFNTASGSPTSTYNIFEATESQFQD